LKAGAREGTCQRSRVRSALLVFQAALSVLLLVGAGLFVRSLGNVSQARLGYDVDRIMLAARVFRDLPMTDSNRVRIHRELLQAAQSMPQVEAATWVSSVPFWSTSTDDVFVPGIDSVDRLGRFTYQTATTDYFRASGTRIIRGRGFTDADRAGAPPIVIVSESMARVLWPGEDALGKCIRIEADTMPCMSVVGIAEDAMQNSLMPEGQNRYYMPIAQYRSTGGFALMLRMRGDVHSQVEPVRKALQVVMPGQTYVNVLAMEDLIARQRRSWRLGATVFVSFGLLAVVVAAVGMYGVIAYNVAQRMHELGVRMALGARQGDVVRLVVGQGVTFAVAGVVLGGALAWAGGHWVEPLLYQQSARDPMVFGVVGLVLVGVALLASSIPAASATRADPQRVLRSE
ncbi:MAG: ABC transporter permease, partial [Cytophagaceae bacterium]|nr:ABC transporter permease [Gemmatimonadaceae bacterium]